MHSINMMPSLQKTKRAFRAYIKRMYGSSKRLASSLVALSECLMRAPVLPQSSRDRIELGFDNVLVALRQPAEDAEDWIPTKARNNKESAPTLCPRRIRELKKFIDRESSSPGAFHHMTTKRVLEKTRNILTLAKGVCPHISHDFDPLLVALEDVLDDYTA